MPKGTRKNTREIRNLLAVADYICEQGRLKGERLDQGVVADTLRWVLGEDELAIVGHYRGNFDAVFGSKRGTELIQEVTSG